MSRRIVWNSCGVLRYYLDWKCHNICLLLEFGNGRASRRFQFTWSIFTKSSYIRKIWHFETSSKWERRECIQKATISFCNWISEIVIRVIKNFEAQVKNIYFDVLNPVIWNWSYLNIMEKIRHFYAKLLFKYNVTVGYYCKIQLETKIVLFFPNFSVAHLESSLKTERIGLELFMLPWFIFPKFRYC